MTKPLIFAIWFVIAITLFLYSYGFVDFNLTLSSNHLVTNFVTWTQSLAMFQRSLSLNVYLGITSILFILYALTVSHRSIKIFPWKPVIILSIIFALSYPFLSSDVFKYLFTGKIIAYYHANPYLYPPQHFEGDLWLRFMRWIHTTTPYGPIFSILAVPYYLIGLGKFVPTLYLYKLTQVGWYCLSIWCIGKLSRSVRAQLYFALNPLVLVEWLVNAHNDAIMVSLLLFSLYLLSKEKRLHSFLVLLLSIGVKYVTVILLPLIILKKKFSTFQVNLYLLSVLAAAPLLYHYSYQYQPWYVTWITPFIAMLGSVPAMVIAGAYTLGSFLRYIPFISTGLWIGTPLTFALYSFLPPALMAIFFLTRSLFKSRSK